MAERRLTEKQSHIPTTSPVPMDNLRNTIAWTLCGVVLILWGLRLWGYGTITTLTTIPSVLLIAWGLAILTWHGGTNTRPQSTRVILVITLLLTLVGLFVWSYAQVITAPAYGTDEMAFDQFAAHLWLHGINPYGRSLAAAFSRYQVSPNGYTWTLSGHPVTLLSYPAQSFLIYVPFILLGWHTQVAVGLNVISWAAALIILFWAVPDSSKPLAIVLASLSVYISYAVGGVTDALFVPFLVLAARKWDQYPFLRGWASLWNPIWFGMAMGIKQTPWIILPFILIGIAFESHRRLGTWRAGIWPVFRYVLITGTVFLIPNVPFIVLNPSTWIKGILTPLIAPTVPEGQGLITLSLFLHIGGGSLFAYTILSAIVLLGLLLIYFLTYPRLKAWTLLIPSLALFVATRSFGSYLVMLVPAAMMSLATTETYSSGKLPTSVKIVLSGIGFVILTSVLAALVIPSPMKLNLIGLHTTGQLATVDQVDLAVTNRTNRLLHPHFTADMSGTLTAFWNQISGPAALQPHQTADYVLAAPNFYSQPALTGGFQMVAFTAHTKTISHTNSYVPSTWHVALIPDAINHPVPYGQSITITAEILNRMDQPVHVNNIPIYLGQIIYAQRGLQYGQAIINDGYPGETPVTATTNSRGEATFTIRDVHPETDPVYFEANLVNNHDYYPYGYSQILPIRFSQ
ncbi:hypothetical protein [Sulfobacillus thermosulfidooxidans]|uniref:hypothetical protein n=1 Tax=Sulfobacillus thermosulfidooxidans TaxID=28034 RepID=UPI0002D74612|nr:hypothetical protein [Sulfobacillus thermosulfidooxidans]